MKGRKIITVLIIINLIFVGIIYSLVNKVNVNNKKQIIKEMTETEYDDNITSLNTSHEEYANHIEESKKKIASALTDMGVATSNEETLENMANNIKRIPLKSNSLPWLNNINNEGNCYLVYMNGNGASWYPINTDGISTIHIEPVQNVCHNIRIYQNFNENNQIGTINVNGGTFDVSDRTDTVYLRIWTPSNNVYYIYKIWCE